VTPSNRFAKTSLRKFLAVSEICQGFALSCRFSEWASGQISWFDVWNFRWCFRWSGGFDGGFAVWPV